MPKARKKKKTEFKASETRCVFLHGIPNKGKLDRLSRMCSYFTGLVNHDIEVLFARDDIWLQLIKNDKKDSFVRALEKSIRPEGINSAFCQNAFDCAFTKLANRLDSMRLDMYSRAQTIFTSSKVLFAMCITGSSRTDMMKAIDVLSETSTGKEFYRQCSQELAAMDDRTFLSHMRSFSDEYAMCALLFKKPQVKNELVPLDSRLMRFEESSDTVSTHVLTMTDPFKKGHRFSVPVTADRDALRRMSQYGHAGTVSVTITSKGKLRVQAAFEKKHRETKIKDIIGVDTGMTDCFAASDGRSIGTMKEVISFYKDEVEPAFAYISDLRNKKRNLLHYIRHHKSLPDDVRNSLLKKTYRLEKMINVAKAPYRKKRHYYQMLDHEVSRSVKEYMSGIKKTDLTVLERLDIKEFKKSRRVNGELSVFARGLLQKKLMEQLNWHGFSFIEVEPDFSSQTCPVCHNVDKESRDSKVFRCTCCGHTDDADHNASTNLKARAEDPDFLEICEKYKYDHKELQKEILANERSRHTAWIKMQAKSA